MKTITHAQSRKRPVNLTLNEDLVQQARQLTNNLSGIVEALLAEFVERERLRRREHSERVTTTIALWNTFEEQHGAFADEYSPL
ncbi:type II toxin-antitoxin system CcdA family antitoxin [Methylocaldum sp.]|uniref:type II toxin-antitoxin system CcdA family antitoxin n=1 Tax=Methylocaldum sp. TaxID=1969727 RepID=UPI002D668E4B|nr:type II toxin-antitoxin system CcdA family antitoxin [Methylocaldum sp.]HYE38021.1 type II toxin-antitoxin system CcdA family antitoxin [Methylocaldum sp.]